MHSSEFPLNMSMQNEQEATPSWHPSQEKQKFPPRDNLFPDNRFPFSASDNYLSPNLSLNSTCADGMATPRNQHMYKGYTSTLLSHSPNSSLVTQFAASSMSLSHRILAQSGRSLPFSSSLGASNVDSLKFLNTDKVQGGKIFLLLICLGFHHILLDINQKSVLMIGNLLCPFDHLFLLLL